MSIPSITEKPIEVPEGILLARAALRRDLPQLLSSRWTRGQWACYGVQGRIGIGKDHLALLREVIRRDIPDGEFIVERIERGAGNDEEEEMEIHDV